MENKPLCAEGEEAVRKTAYQIRPAVWLPTYVADAGVAKDMRWPLLQCTNGESSFDKAADVINQLKQYGVQSAVDSNVSCFKAPNPIRKACDNLVQEKTR